MKSPTVVRMSSGHVVERLLVLLLAGLCGGSAWAEEVPAPLAPIPAPLPAPVAAQPPPELVHVHLKTSDPNIILDGWSPALLAAPQVMPGTMQGPAFTVPVTSRGRITCVAPCDHWLDRAGHYHIAGFGVSETREFGLPVNTGPEITLEVIPGSARMRAAGAVLVVIGVLGVLTGVPIAIAGAVKDDGVVLRDAGLGVAGVSAALIAIGSPLVALSDTKVLLESGGPAVRLARLELPLRAGLRLSPRGLVF